MSIFSTFSLLEMPFNLALASLASFMASISYFLSVEYLASIALALDVAITTFSLVVR